MSETIPFKIWFDKKTGDLCSQGTMPANFKSNLMKLMPKIERIIEEEAARKALSRSDATKKPVKSAKSKVEKRTVAPEIPVSKLKKTKVTHGWVPSGEYVVVAGRKIPGMVYICDSDSMGKAEKRKHEESAIWIDVAKYVSGRDKKGFHFRTTLYGKMEPANRASYLDWLADGKKDTDFHYFYAFRYFLGLEHRLLCDGIAPNESKEIRNELERLSEVYSDYEYREFRGSIKGLLEKERLILRSETVKTGELAEFFDLPVGLQVEISDAISDGRALTGRQVFGWFYNSDESSNYDSDFLIANKKEFLKDFSKFYPKGIIAAPTDKTLKVKYTSATKEFKLSETIKVKGRPVMDIRNIKLPLIRAEAIMDRIYSKSAGAVERRTEDIESYFGLEDDEAYDEMLERQNAYADLEFIEWAKKMAKGQIPTTCSELLQKLKGERLRGISIKMWWKASDKLADLGFDVAPNSMFVPRNRSLTDQLILFEIKEPYAMNSKGYCHMEDYLILLGVGSYLTSTIGLNSKDTEEKLRMLVSGLESSKSKCNQSDIAAIQSNIETLLLKPADKRFIRNLKNHAAADRLSRNRSLVIEAAVKLNLSQAKTVSEVEKIYKMFKLDPKLAYSDLHAGEFVPKASGRSAKTKKSAKLDEARIKSIRTDTEKVSEVLGRIFSEEGGQDSDTGTDGKAKVKSRASGKAKSSGRPKTAGETKSNGKRNATTKAKKSLNSSGKGVAGANGKRNSTNTYPGLDGKHASLIGELVQKSYWSEKSFAKLAEKHGLMPGGVTETINEWVYERYDDILLEENQGFHVATAIAESMKSESAGK